MSWGGGLYPWEFLSDGARYDPGSDSWVPTSNTGAPSPRQEHTAVWTGSEIVIWGESNRSALANGARYDPRSDSWTPTSSLGAPSARAAHTAVWTGAEVIVWGGSFDGSGGRYDPADDSWQATSTSGAPAPRVWHSAVWTGREMILWGGLGPQYGYYDALHTGGGTTLGRTRGPP